MRSVGGGKDGPHIVRHTAATWTMQAGTDLYEASGFLGMSTETLEAVDFQENAASASAKRRQTPSRKAAPVGS